MNINSIYAVLVFLMTRKARLTEDQAKVFLTELKYKPIHPNYDGIMKQFEEAYAVATKVEEVPVEAPSIAEIAQEATAEVTAAKVAAKPEVAPEVTP